MREGSWPAWTAASLAALDALPAVAADLGTDTDVTERLRAEYDERWYDTAGRKSPQVTQPG
ncbi:hypothetical protein [Streptomyces sp. NPDC058623]|uniref:hypothetical protein n=1 Tax=Streptomyces sp. NPDC058623 TaxID=3346563 RepID=UPI003667B80B